MAEGFSETPLHLYKVIGFHALDIRFGLAALSAAECWNSKRLVLAFSFHPQI